MSKLTYYYQTKIGQFSIALSPQTNKWHIYYQDQDLGSYATPDQAADDLAGGHTISLSNGYETDFLGIPGSIVDWD